MAKRYELSETQWQVIEPILPGKKRGPGRTEQDNRLFVNAVLWVLRSGAFWSDLPERYGSWKTVHKRFTRWAEKGVWKKIFEALTSDLKNDYVMIDSTIVRAHQQAICGKGVAKMRLWAFPRRVKHLDSYAHRCSGPSAALCFYRLGKSVITSPLTSC